MVFTQKIRVSDRTVTFLKRITKKYGCTYGSLVDNLVREEYYKVFRKTGREKQDTEE